MTVLPSPLPPLPTEPTWYRIALAEVGVQEIEGAADNPRILEYLSMTSFPKALIHDETAWCSAFVNWCIARAGLKGTGLANARSWLTWGQPLPPSKPKLGCIAVFSRPQAGPASGHVALYVSETKDEIRVLGGNQDNRVCAKNYPRERLLGYRWPKMSMTNPPAGAFKPSRPPKK